MPRPLSPLFNLDDAIRRYQAGEPSGQIAASMKVNRATLDRKLRAAGVAKQRDASWVDQAVALHLEGVTQEEIGRRLGRTQPTISAALLRRGYRTSRSDAAARRMARASTEERKALAAAAHDAVRGMTRTVDELEKRARGKQRTRAHATPEELAMAALLPGSVPQLAIGKYNIDIGAEPVAVELFGGNWHADGRHRARLPQRVEYIADAGWNLLIVWSTLGHTLDVAAVAQDALAYLELSRRDPSFRRQYRVIWGDGQLVAAGCVDDDERTLIPPGVRRYDTAGR